MSVSCKIKLNNSKLVYPKQTVSGVVKLNIFENYVVKGFSLKLLGYLTGALCSSDRTKEYFLILKIIIYDKPTIIRRGFQSYRFKFYLPDDIPPTINTETSKICYKIRATLERPWDHDTIFQTRFNVGTAFNLNLFCPSLYQPLTCSHTIKYLSLFNRDSWVAIKLHIPRRVYAIDDVIPVSIEVNNMSETSVYFKFALQENIAYGGTSLKKQKPIKLTRVNCTRVKGPSELFGRETQENIIYNLRVPHVVATIVECSKIYVGYNLVVTMLARGLHLKRNFKLPVSIYNKK